jgi:enoyl-CoA hydratase/carnithine racemase
VSDVVSFERTDGLAVITLNREDKLNAMTREMYDEISSYLREIDEDDETRVGIVTGAGGKAFSAGADLVAVHSSTSESTEPWSAWRPLRFDSGLEVQKPLIAAIEGYCLAGGLELALFCDIRVAGVGSQFGTPEVKWNLLHGYGAQVLPSIIGLSNALYLLLTGSFIDVNRAERLGLVQEVVPAGGALERAYELARQIAKNGPMAVRMTKELAMRSRDTSLPDGLRYYQSLNDAVHASSDLEEGTRAFSEKRDPRFIGA